jgi:hypothetical protein
MIGPSAMEIDPRTHETSSDHRLGIDSARVAAEENAMTDPNRLDATDPTDASDAATRDPDRHSTWNTLDGTVDVDEVLDEDDLDNFLVEPIPNPLDPDATRGQSE